MCISSLLDYLFALFFAVHFSIFTWKKKAFFLEIMNWSYEFKQILSPVRSVMNSIYVTGIFVFLYSKFRKNEEWKMKKLKKKAMSWMEKTNNDIKMRGFRRSSNILNKVLYISWFLGWFDGVFGPFSGKMIILLKNIYFWTLKYLNLDVISVYASLVLIFIWRFK